MAIPRRRSLAGTNGIPLEKDRLYVKPLYYGARFPGPDGTGSPAAVVLPGGTVWEIDGVHGGREFGRAMFGNLCVHYSVSVAGVPRDLWWEHGAWFVRRPRR